MAGRSEITRELEELESPLAGMPAGMPYWVPAGYFESLSGEVSSIAAACNEADPVLNLPKHLPFEVPEHYFSLLPGVMTSIASSPLTNDPKTKLLSVPAGYFEGLPDKMLALAKASRNPVKRSSTITFVPARVLRWAAAAMVVLGIGIGSVHYYSNRTPDLKAFHQLAKVDQNLLHEYVEQNIDDFDAEVLEHHVAMNSNAMNSLGQLEQQDIVQYLDETGWNEKATN